jgi:hypothetical protein
MRTFLTAAVIGLSAACTPPAATTTETPEPPAAPAVGVDDESAQMLLNALDPVLSENIGQPVNLQPTTVNIRDEWAFIIGQPRQTNGAPIDWSATSYAQRAADGALDGDGQTFALLKSVNGAWEVLEYVVGPTDAAHIEWAGKHGVPPDILGLPSN